MSETTTCANCGNEMPASAAFCTNCGTRRDPAASAPPPPGGSTGDDATRVDNPGLHDSTQVHAPPSAPTGTPPAAPPPADGTPPVAPWQPSSPAPGAPGAPAQGGWGDQGGAGHQPPAAPAAPAWQQPQAAPGTDAGWGAPAGQPAAAPAWGAPAAAPARTTTARSTGGSPLGGLLAVGGGVLTIVSLFLAWLGTNQGDATISAWDLTSGDEALESSDPYILIALGIAAVVVGVLLFLGVARPIMRIAAVVVGIAIVVVLALHWMSVSNVVEDEFPSSVEVSAKIGFFLAGAGGVLTALAALLPARETTRAT